MMQNELDMNDKDASMKTATSIKEHTTRIIRNRINQGDPRNLFFTNMSNSNSNVSNLPTIPTNVNTEEDTSLSLVRPIHYFWRRIKPILRNKNNDRTVFSILEKNELKNALGISLEVPIMGSALILTLSLQIQEVVGSRGGFQFDQPSIVSLIFMITVALSFAFSFYSIVIAAVLLIPLASLPSK